MKLNIKNSMVVLLLVSWANANPVNLALHKDCILAPEPNYELTMDPLDRKQLTDGVIGESLWYKNYKKKTVGWAFKGIVEITLDLGKASNIDAVKVYTTGGGRSGVEYPEYIIGMASTDGRNYSPVSMADSARWKSGVKGFAEPKVMALQFGTKCRYVKLLVRPNGTVFFSDEVQVLAAENDCKISGTPALSNSQTIDYAERLRQLDRNLLSLSKAYQNSSLVSENFDRKISEYQSQLANFKVNLAALNVLEILEERLDRMRAEFLREKYKVSWFCTEADPIDILRPADLPPKPEDGCQLSLYLWQNEHALGALNVVNCSDKEKEFSLSVSPLAVGDKSIGSEPYVSVRRALYVYSKNGGFFADPLVLQGDKPFTVKPGETAQLFIEFNAKDLSSGQYTSSIGILCAGEIKTVPLKIEIADKSFPEKLDFMTCNWDYITDDSIIPNSISKMAVDDLKDHHFNVTVIPHHKIYNSSPASGKQTEIIRIKPSFKTELQLRKHADFRLLFLALKMTHKRFGQNIYSIDWKLKFQAFIRDLVKTLNAQGYTYQDYAIYPYDEYLGKEFIHVAKLIREVDPKIKIYANSVGQGVGDVRRAAGWVDIWCPYFNEVAENKKLLDEIKEHCKEVWCYGTELRQDYVIENAAKLNKLYHRTIPIKAAGMGLKGAGFWTYADRKGGHYNYFDKRIYGVIYDSRYSPQDCISEPIVPSKRWQMWREGVEDAVALKDHPQLLKELMAKSPNEITSEYLQNLRIRADRKSTAENQI